MVISLYKKIKTTFYHHQKSIIMRKLIFTIGTVLVSFTGAFAETNDRQTNTKVEMATVGDSTDVKPEALFVTTTVKSDEQIILDDIEVTESELEVVAPLLPGKTTDEVIDDNNKIIEGIEVEVSPLDFKKINQQQKVLKLNNKRLIGSL